MQDELKNFEALLKKTNAQLIRALKLTRQGIKLYENPVPNAYKLKEWANKFKEAIEKVEAIHELPIQELVSGLQADVDRFRDEFKFEFGGALEKELKIRGFELRGQLPTLYANYYTIKLDFQTGKAIILFGTETLMSGVSIKPHALANALTEIDKELKKEIIPSTQLLAHIYEAWKRIGETNAPVIKVLRELVFLIQPPKFFTNPTRRNFVEYSRAKFGYDLYRLERSSPLEYSSVVGQGFNLAEKKKNGHKLSLITATFDATAQKGNYIWVPTNERGDGINYAYLSFK